MQNFRDLKVWEKGHALVLAVYKITARFPREELYGLTSQMRRAAVSIPANIAEGCGKDGGSDFARFLQIAAASASELEYHLLLANDLGLLERDVCEHLTGDVTEARRMLAVLIQRVRGNKPTTRAQH